MEEYFHELNKNVFCYFINSKNSRK